MGKTICLLIALVFLTQAEYVKSLQPALQSQEKPQKTPKTTRNSRIPSDKNLNKAENSKILLTPSKQQNSQNSRIPLNTKNTSGFSKNIPTKSLNPAKSDEYIFWAHFFTTNQMLSTRVIAISKAMKKSDESEFLPFCELRATKAAGQSELEFFRSHEEELADCFTKSPFKVLEYSGYELQSAKQKAILHTNITQIPIHFIAIFKAQGATILAKISQ
ncbi:hypothetical protein [Campylobacter sp.]|uniref:hypothetical protein n=1 Tax=Campylobacter sp. TaxID=205 RepID=UPI002A692189|nr:hypothetical protein [Campylobacter sp.]MDD7703180.1 hypothetical protein [Campylobacteraceae bacterium]MDY2634750.1 hypothetical protein [Campylobacter sp.]